MDNSAMPTLPATSLTCLDWFCPQSTPTSASTPLICKCYRNLLCIPKGTILVAMVTCTSEISHICQCSIAFPSPITTVMKCSVMGLLKSHCVHGEMYKMHEILLSYLLCVHMFVCSRVVLYLCLCLLCTYVRTYVCIIIIHAFVCTYLFLNSLVVFVVCVLCKCV